VTHILRRTPKWLGAICLFACAAFGGDDPQVSLPIRAKTPARRADFRLESDLVLIPVSVTDARNHAITGLGQEAFRVYEDKTEQAVVQFLQEDIPISVGIVFDASNSMTGKLDKSREAMKQFLRFANPEDEFFLVEFNNRPSLTVPFTREGGDIQNRLLQVQPKGTTALLDAVCLAMESLKHARYGRKALLILSDGGDNHSRYSEAEIRSRVRESDLWIYAIGIYEPRSGFHANEPTAGARLLEGLAADSGGRHFAVDNLADLPAVAARISVELRNQYVIGYRPSNPRRDGKYHSVQVNVVQAGDLRVSWRPGYFGGLE
jgi:Ca-activated chloride channel family protein